ncbi:MAG: bifunctional phosphopantothenoylcysteine decarboxylase/phosphopantothenate--cysteine ligase CoaBC [Chromatiales bacterium]|jgi:phosphopantothenoylcysteine decarboxylase/phosphopantothenate--cysteine ligase
MSVSGAKLSGRRILLGISGGIAAYKTAELVRLCRKAGAEVQVVLTQSASQFVTPLTLQALSGRPVRSDLFDQQQEAGMSHIELARWADLVLVAPASANTIAKLAQGLADDLLTTLCLATEAPLVLAPAMNRVMWHKPVTQQNVARLREQGVQLWGPAEGEQACGETGAGRMLEPAELFARLDRLLHNGPLQDARVLVTAGPTQEPIDPVRFIGNRSSGKMGFALAEAFVQAGAHVTLVAGPVNLATPAGVERVDVVTAAQMHATVMQRVGACDLFAACAAVADYHVADVAAEKIKRNDQAMHLQLLPNPDILATVAALSHAPFTLGFAAETQQVEAHARAKLERKGIDMIAANQVGQSQGGFEDDNNALTVIWRDGQKLLPMMDKKELARQLVRLVTDVYHAQAAVKNT